MRSSIKRLFSRWHLDNIKVVRRVIVSVVGVTVVLIGIALLVLPGPAFVVIPVGLAILATEYAWARRLLRKVRQIASDVVSGRKRTSVPDLVSSGHRCEQEKHAAECAEHQAHDPK
jgi:tellurite resistance protein TerC